MRSRLGSAALSGALVAAAAAPAWAIRPTDGDGWSGNGYDPAAEVFSHDSPGGHFRVWYVTTSTDAVQEGDADADGIPDFVEEVAERADATWQSAIDERGFRPPLDDSVYHDRPDYGGDGRYDIYLLNVVNGDGYRVAEVCTDQPHWCSGYYAMENDFRGFGYPSDSIAIRILTSHELFHAIQDAYDADQARQWTEGTATWNEEMTFPEQDDFEGYLAEFLERPERPFDRAGGPMGDPYPYGAAIWPAFLEERFGPGVVRAIWEACEDDDGSDPDFLEAADEVLATGHASSLEDAWVEFTVWNLMTAERADPARAYAGGASWPSVRLEAEVAGFPATSTVKVEGMSARYLPFVLPDRAGAPLRVTVSTPAGAPVRATVLTWDGVALGEPVAVAGGDDPRARHVDLTPAGAVTLFVVVTGVTRGELPHDVGIELGDPPAPPPPEPEESSGCGCRAARARSPGWPAIALLAVGALHAARRRRPARPRAA